MINGPRKPSGTPFYVIVPVQTSKLSGSEKSASTELKYVSSPRMVNTFSEISPIGDGTFATNVFLSGS